MIRSTIADVDLSAVATNFGAIREFLAAEAQTVTPHNHDGTTGRRHGDILGPKVPGIIAVVKAPG